MKSVTKFEVTEAQMRDMFRAAGVGEVTDIQEISDGWFNSVFSATDTKGKKYVIKIAPPKDVRVLTHETNLMASEVDFYRILSEQTAVKTPNIVFSDFSEKIVPTPYFIMDFLSGERLDKAALTPEEKQIAQDKWSWVLAEFHKVKGSGFSYTQAGLKDNWKDALAHMTQILIDDAASFGKKCKLGEKLLTEIEKFAGVLADVPSVLVNFDLHSMNIFCERTPDGDIELTVLDLERGFWGDAIGDFVLAGGFKPLPKKDIIVRYNRYAETPVNATENELIRYNLMIAYLSVIMYTERFSRFRGLSRFFNPVYIMGTLGYKFYGKTAFSALKKLSK